MKIYKTELNKRSVIRWKVYIDRSRMYIGYIQFFLIGFVFLKSFDNQNINDLLFRYLWISIPASIILFILLSLLLGYMDSKLGLRQEEQRNLSYSNPVMMEMLNTIRELKAEVHGLKEELHKKGVSE
jgi:hypothetical protein